MSCLPARAVRAVTRARAAVPLGDGLTRYSPYMRARLDEAKAEYDRQQAERRGTPQQRARSLAAQRRANAPGSPVPCVDCGATFMRRPSSSGTRCAGCAILRRQERSRLRRRKSGRTDAVIRVGAHDTTAPAIPRNAAFPSTGPHSIAPLDASSGRVGGF